MLFLPKIKLDPKQTAKPHSSPHPAQLINQRKHQRAHPRPGVGPHTFLCCTTHPAPSLTSGGRQRKGFHFIQWQTDTIPTWMSVSWYGGAVKSPHCQKCYSWEIGARSIFCLQWFRIGIPGWKTHFNAKRWAGVLGIQTPQPPLQMSTFPHSHGERKEEMPPLSRAKCLQLISLSPNAPLLHYTAQRSHPRSLSAEGSN